MSDSPETAESILSLTISDRHYRLLEQAAALTGLSVDAYVLHHALSSAVSHVALYNYRPQAEDALPATAEGEHRAEVDDRPSISQSSDSPVASPLDNNSQDINNLAKAILSTLAWSSPEIIRDIGNRE
ncbi:hypothetical protein [Roseofilum casamattae]|uniref:DUF1778 domain-containing protein n=1 Tax=Roseofilum casamattae BLCC-M143 TaxID=3022442 RepID=A0ABT7C1F0_9CYAN|nr:hypothetical protein [Roseofilum casamattae]MDJ1185282.1 hypothetical protein [Roseofilum casamattae BLCC-M143]